MKKILALSVASFALAGALNAADLKIAGSSTVYPFTSFVLKSMQRFTIQKLLL